LKYWTRQPYLGFGVDAHSMLPSATAELEAARFAPADSLEQYMSGANLKRTAVSRQAALEESFFLGLRFTRGVSLRELSLEFGDAALQNPRATIRELIEDGLMELCGEFACLTARGRLLSNEVFERFLAVDELVS
jgi:oxygen-independent coproporphyrinogen-3 oxidase